ncbi:MAG: FHA domain-containing protein [Planctomycetes bacterium]|nr:FHA domain-containing protein [Planctomycetota bacterium]
MSLCLLPIDEGPPIRLDQTIILIGRHPSCDVVLSQSLKVSRKHCCLVQVSGRCVIRDLGSLNGVWVNGRRIEREAVLKVGDEVRIADVAYVVQELAGAEADQEAAEQKATEPADSADYPIPIDSAAELVDLSGELSPVPVPEDRPVSQPETPSEGPLESDDDLLLPADIDLKSSGDALPLADD